MINTRKGNCLANVVMGNFFGLLKSKLLDLKESSSLDELRKDIMKYIEYYNKKQIKPR